MKFFLALLCSSYFLLLPSISVPAIAQSTGQSTQTNPQQYMSHQMHQPPPDPNDRYRISDQLLDEIRDLYVQAKRELEAKNQDRNKTPKTPER